MSTTSTRQRGSSSSFVVALCLLNLWLNASCDSPTKLSEVAPPQVVMNAAAADRSVFLSWIALPGSVAHRLDYRRIGELDWRSRSLVSSQDHAVVDSLTNGVTYEFRLFARLGRQAISSYSVSVSPKARPDCAFPSYLPKLSFFCTQAAMDLALRQQGLDPKTLRCRGQLLVQWDVGAPDCLYVAPDGSRFLLLRGADNQFSWPIDIPGPDRVRGALRYAIWRSQDPFANSGSAQPVVEARANVGRVTRYHSAIGLVFPIDDMLRSRVTQFLPVRATAGRFAIYHEGHGGAGIEIGAETIDWLLDRGWQVFAVDMPMSGINLSDQGAGFELNHLDFWKLDDGITSPVAKFMIPVKHVVDYIEQQSSSEPTILLLGRSGGGWTSYVYSALDGRIDLMVNVAGGRPMSQRLDAPWGPLELGDNEQFAPELFSAIRHEDVMASGGRIGSLHIFNVKDPCCYRVMVEDPFTDYLIAAGSSSGRRVSVFVDTENGAHSIGPRGYEHLDLFFQRVLSQ